MPSSATWGTHRNTAQAVLLSDPLIFSQVMAVQKVSRLAGPRGKLLADLLRDMRHTGAELSPEGRRQFSALRAELNRLSASFSTNMNADIPQLDLTRLELVSATPLKNGAVAMHYRRAR